jgi:glycosyltransferase involved in cell wall biosynthesis
LDTTKLSVVIPVFNESSLIKELLTRVKSNVELITTNYEIIVVDDGSQDTTWREIEKESLDGTKIIGIKLSRNFGHHYAITAGLHKSVGEWVVVMDGDLQDRPEVIPDLYQKAQEGFDVVFVTRENRPEGIYYKIAQKLFYRVLRLLSGINFNSRQANFSIISRKVVEAFMIFPENARFYGSTIMWLGFNRSEIFADHGIRFSGKPSYTFKKRIKLALDIIISFSNRPLKFAVGVGLIVSIFSIALTIWIIAQSLKDGNLVSEWASIITIILFSTGMIMTVLGISGVYIGEIFKQVKNRPLYIISKTIDKKVNS